MNGDFYFIQASLGSDIQIWTCIQHKDLNGSLCLYFEHFKIFNEIDLL